MKINNDQAEIINACKSGDYKYVWSQIKFVGYDDEKDISERFLIFTKAFKEFDPYRNNNFIGFYKKYIKYFRQTNQTHALAISPKVAAKLNRETISPTRKTSRLVSELKRWRKESDYEDTYE